MKHKRHERLQLTGSTTRNITVNAGENNLAISETHGCSGTNVLPAIQEVLYQLAEMRMQDACQGGSTSEGASNYNKQASRQGRIGKTLRNGGSIGEK